MTKSEFLTLRVNLLGGMNDYIRNVVNLEEVTASWDMGGVPVDVTESGHEFATSSEILWRASVSKY